MLLVIVWGLQNTPPRDQSLDLVYDGRLVMQWIKGQQNPADLGANQGAM